MRSGWGGYRFTLYQKESTTEQTPSSDKIYTASWEWKTVNGGLGGVSLGRRKYLQLGAVDDDGLGVGARIKR